MNVSNVGNKYSINFVPERTTFPTELNIIGISSSNYFKSKIHKYLIELQLEKNPCYNQNSYT